jgi:hypothetical protein
MSLIGLIILLVVVGVMLYCLNSFVPMDPRFKKAINIIAGLLLFIYMLYWLAGFLGWDLGAPPPHWHR